MSYDRNGLRFEGAFNQPGDLEAKSGVYVIWCKSGENWAVLDVGEASDVRARVLGHDRKDCWRRHCSGDIYYAAHYTPGNDEAGRREIEGRLRRMEKPPCGEI